MNRFIAFALLLSLALSLWGCSRGIQDGAAFHYCRKDYLYGQENGVIAPEQRDITGHVGDLSFLISLYLMGPLDEELKSPFPKNTRLELLEFTRHGLQIQLSPVPDSFTDSEFTLACACLTLTCLEITDKQTFTITSGERSVIMNRNNLILSDSTIQETIGGE